MKLTPKLGLYEYEGAKRYTFYCPACHEAHCYSVGSPNRPNWNFNGNADFPEDYRA